MSVPKSIIERVAVVETKQDAMIACIEEIKINVKDLHDCLDNTRDDIMEKLEHMFKESAIQHDEIAKKVSSIEKLKDKWAYAVMGVVAFVGWASGHTDLLLKVVGR